MKKILILEDDESIRDEIVILLNTSGYIAETMQKFDNSVEDILKASPDMVLLDINLPFKNGKDILREVRQVSDVPVIMVTSSDAERDELVSMGYGADDYITKPFSPSELTARVDSLYRRVSLAEQRNENNFKEELKSGIFTLNLRNRALMKNGKMIELTQVEFQIMEYFFSNPGVALDRTDILNHVWGEAYVGEEKIVDVNIRRLRMKVEDEPSNPKYIVTVWGLGYKWDT